MSELPSRHRPFSSRQDLAGYEREALRRGTLFALAAFAIVFGSIVTLVMVTPQPSQTIALLTP